MSEQTVEQVLLQIALDLATNLPEGHHYQRLINAVNKVMPCDASALFIFDEDACLVPVAVSGLSSTVLGRRFTPSAHPRLAAILKSRQPIRFDTNSELPDPFDGLVMNTPEHAIDVHDCMGCSLYVDDQMVGALTLDALAVGAFSRIDPLTIETFAALAAATIRNVTMFDALKQANRQQKNINQLLIQQARAKEGDLVGVSPQIKQLRRNIAMVAQSNFVVLISGETGTGKELVAHAVHAQSSRSDKPMVYVNCAALPESIAESELFGHIKGAFTGATSHRAGKFELADGGTLFLDEVGELPLLLQAKLLRVIQQGEVQRVGADKNSHVDVRIIAATNRALPEEVEAGRFRADLYHRLNVFPISVPALRQREGDIPVLAGYLLEKLQTQFHAPNLHIHPRTLVYLEQQKWPGNVRELEHTLMRAGLQAIQQGKTVIVNQHLGTQDEEQSLPAVRSSKLSFRERVDEFQKQQILDALRENNGVWAQAAKQLDMDRGNLYRLGKKLGINQ